MWDKVSRPRTLCPIPSDGEGMKLDALTPMAFPATSHARVLTLGIGISLLASSWGIAGEPLKLEAYVEQVRSAHPSIQAAKFRAEAQEQRVAPAGAWEDPFFAVGPDDKPFEGDGGGIRFQLSQAIPFPGARGARKEAARGRAEASRQDSVAQERSLRVIAIQTFLRALYVRKAIRLNSENRKLIENMIQSTKARYRTGDPTHHDWLLARVEHSLLQVEDLRLERDRKISDRLLNELRDRPQELEKEALELAEPDFEKAAKAPSEDLEALLRDQPELGALDSTVISWEAEARAARKSFIPAFVVQGMAMTGHGEEPGEWGLMVGINLPLFAGARQSNLARAADYEKEAALFERRALENRLRNEAKDAMEELRSARDVVSLYVKEVIPATEIAVKDAQAGYSARRLALSELLDTLRVRKSQNLELAAARMDLLLSEVRLRDLLAAPPLLRLAPGRPTLFGRGAMGEPMGGPIRMGSGMSGALRKTPQRGMGDQGAASGMSGMGGM